MLIRALLTTALALAVGPTAIGAEPPAEPQPGERQAFNLTPEILEKIREWTGAEPGEQPDLSKLTPEQRAELMEMLAGKEVEGEGGGVVSFGGAGADAKAPPVGQPAPDLSIDEIIAGAEGDTTLTWDALESKVVVLEFWATWCAPCIAALPHLNDLAEQFAEREVVFISITNEDRATVEAFLPDHEFPGLVVSDTDRSMAEAYGVTAIPRTFIVGADGTLLGVSHPMMVKPEHLDAALRGEALDLPGMPKPQVDGKPLTIKRGDDGKTTFTVSRAASDDDGYWEDRPPRVGDPAPPLTIDRYFGTTDLPEPADFSWDDLAGRVTVLDFSATWCAPCIQSIPHMNELVAEFAGEPVAFLTISNEAEQQAEKLATEHGLTSDLGWDADGSTFEDYWVNGIPRVAIIDAEGRIAALTHPNLVTPEAIRSVLAGGTIDLPNSHPDPVRMDWNHNGVGRDLADDSTPRTIVERTDILSGQMHRSPKTGIIRAGGTSPLMAFSTAFGGMSDDIELEVELPEDEYLKIDIVPPDGKLETSQALLLNRLCAMYGVETERRMRTVPAKALRRIDGAEPPPAGEGEGGMRFMGGTLDMPNGTTADLAKFLRYAVRVPVVDETGLDGSYQVTLKWDFTGGADAVNEALAEYGLELVDVEAEHEVLIVRDAAVN